MIGGESGFFVSGGTLEHDAPSYVERRADEELYSSLSRGEFCYVLTSRQMGKSSLMVRTAARLREQGLAVAILDLTMVGRNVTIEQWYFGLLSSIGQQLGIQKRLREFWVSQPLLGPAQRWMAALTEVVLPAAGEETGVLEPVVTACAESRQLPAAGGPYRAGADLRLPRLVVFIDEIDAVRSLPFPTDEFFAGVRECFNRRAQQPELHGLTFCLLGVGSPSDLIRDTRTTPFNIGRRIELSDFTREEAFPLAVGLAMREPGRWERSKQRADALLNRVFYWTGGHPYLTQRLCQAVAADRDAAVPGHVDRHCRQLFLVQAATERDDNLLFVRERLLKSEVDLARLLRLYRRVRAGEALPAPLARRVPNEPGSPLAEVLRLSGVVRVDGGWLRVRNRIYARVFTTGWVAGNLPDAALRRQRAKVRRKVIRLGTVCGIAGGCLAAVGASVSRHWHEADQRRDAARLTEYIGAIGRAQRAIKEVDFAGAAQLLEPWRAGPRDKDLRSWEWYHLWRRAHPELAVLPAGPSSVDSLRFLQGTARLIAATYDQHATEWDLGTGRPLFGRSVSPSLSANLELTVDAISPDGRLMAAASDIQETIRGGPQVRFRAKSWQIVLASLPDGPAETVLRGTGSHVTCLAFSPDSEWIAGANGNAMDATEAAVVWLWHVRTRRKTDTLVRPSRVSRFAFSPRGDSLAMGSADGEVRLWHLRRRILSGALPFGLTRVAALAFSRDGRYLAAAGRPTVGLAEVCVVEVATGREVARRAFRSGVSCLAFAPNRRLLAVGTGDPTIVRWAFASGRDQSPITAHPSGALALAYSDDGAVLASGGIDSVVKLWDTAREEPRVYRGAGRNCWDAAFEPRSGAMVARARDGLVFWSPESDRAELIADTGGAAYAISPTGVRAFASGSTVQLQAPGGGPERSLSGGVGRIRCLAFAPGGDRLAVGGEDGRLTICDLAAGRNALLASEALPVSHLVFSHDGTRLAARLELGSVSLWHLDTGERWVHTSPAATGPLAFSPDDRTLAIAAEDTILLWDAESRREKRISGQGTPATCLAFSPDGRTLASGTMHSEIRLWNTARSEELMSLGPCPGTCALSFAPDGSSLRAVGGDGSVRVWSAAPRP